MIKTRKANPNKPARVMVYGVEGVGKSTFGAKSYAPIFISAEGGTDQLTDVNGNPIEEMSGVNSWDTLRTAVKQLGTEKHSFGTVVLDSADWIEGLCHAKIIGSSGKSIITCNGGYGTGYRQSQTLHKELIDDLNVLRDQVGMNVILTAHAHVKAVKDPAMLEDYDGFEPKCHEFVSSLWREWVDALLFVRFKTFVKSSDDTTKARAMGDGTRAIYTVKQPAFQAKNRYGMPPELVFTEKFWEEFVKYAKKGIVQESKEDLEKECVALVDKITDKDIATKAIDHIASASNVEKLQQIRTRLREITGNK